MKIAVRQYQLAIELDPGQAQTHLHLGVELGGLGKLAQAEQEFREALRLAPNSVEAQMNLGIALYKEQKIDDALKQFEEILQHNPGNPTALSYVQLLQNRTP